MFGILVFFFINIFNFDLRQLTTYIIAKKIIKLLLDNFKNEG